MQYYNTDSLNSGIEGCDAAPWPIPPKDFDFKIPATVISDQGVLLAGQMFRREKIRRFWVQNKSPTIIGGMLSLLRYNYLYFDTHVMQKTLIAVDSYNFQSVWGCLQEMKKGNKLISPLWWHCVNYRNGMDRFERWANEKEYVPTDVERSRSPDQILDIMKQFCSEDNSWNAYPLIYLQLCRKHFAGVARGLEQMLSL